MGSEMKTKKEDLELLSKEQNEKIKLLEKDLDSYKAMCDFSSGMTSSRLPKMRRSDVISSLECEMREANDDIIKNLRQEVIDLKARIDVQSEENRLKARRLVVAKMNKVYQLNNTKNCSQSCKK